MPPIVVFTADRPVRDCVPSLLQLLRPGDLALVRIVDLDSETSSATVTLAELTRTKEPGCFEMIDVLAVYLRVG